MTGLQAVILSTAKDLFSPSFRTSPRSGRDPESRFGFE
jgi:hypothetical protein